MKFVIPVLVLLAACSAGPPDSSLVGLGNPFADVYPARRVGHKAIVSDLAVVDGRVYLAHGTTAGAVRTRPLYYDIAAQRWGVDEVPGGGLRQEGISRLHVGPSGRLYAAALDALGVDAVLMIRRERDGTWTERVADRPENHSRDTVEWLDPETGDTLVFIQNAAPYFPDVSVSYDAGASFVRYGSEPSATPPLRYYQFFPFGGELYAASFRPQAVPGFPNPTPRPYLLRYTRDRRRPFEVVAATREAVFPGPGSDVRETAELAGRLVAASGRFYAGDALERGRMADLGVPGTAVDLVAADGAVYLLTRTETGSALYVTRDARTVRLVGAFERPFVAVEAAGGAFYLAESGAGAEHTLWRYRPAPEASASGSPAAEAP